MADINEGSFQQSIVKAFDEPSETLKVTIANPEDIISTDITDSTKIGDGGGVNYAGITVANSRKALNTYQIDSNESVLIDEVSDSLTYFGYANAGSSVASGVWKIKRLSISGTVTSILYADGNSNYDNVWNNRASLTYL